MRTYPARISRRGGRRAAFTLMELMLVLGLLAALMFLAVPTFQSLLQGSLQQEVNHLSGVIRLLRNEAVLTGTPYRLMLQLNENRYFVERQDEYGSFGRVEDPRVLAPHRMPGGMVLEELWLLGRSYRPDEINPLPVLVDESGYIDPFLLYFTHDGSEYTLRVKGFTGRVALLEGHVEP